MMRGATGLVVIGLLLGGAACGGGEGIEAEVAETVQVDWAADAMQYRDREGERFAFVCPSDGTEHLVWGTDLYSDDSSVCTAAVHAGKLTFEEGGTVEVEIRPGADSYEDSERNGVSTSSWGAWDGSFIFP